MSIKKLDKQAFKSFVNELIASDQTVVAPTAKADKFAFAPIESADDMRLDYDVTLLPPKKYLLPQVETLMTYQVGGTYSSEMPQEKTVLLGVHPYDMVAINQMDEIFSQDETDIHYMTRRENITIVACDVVTPSKNVFASTMGTATIKKGYDVLITDIGNAWVVEIATVQQEVAEEGPARRVSAGGLGSGFLISADGLVMTASHVVQVADEVAVRFVTGAVVKARVVASAPSMDVALIRVEQVPDGIVPVVLGDSDTTQVGDRVFVVGAPFGISHSLSVGYVSARRTPNNLFGGLEQVELLQTDTAINQGNSGGPMFNMRGEAIGIVSHILSTSGGFQGLGFVITSNVARRVLLEDPTPWTGLNLLLLEGKLARALNLPRKAGLLVQGVAAGSPGAALGLRSGDLPTQIGDQKLTLGGDIILSIHGISIGDANFKSKIHERSQQLGDDDKFELVVLRDGDVIHLSKTVSVLQHP